MTTALDIRRALTPKWTKDQVELMKRTIAKGTTDDEFKVFLYTCKRTGLDPFVKQIYAIKRYDAESGSYVMGIQVGIDGMRLIASRTDQLAGVDAPVFDVDPNETWHPFTATVTVYRMKDGERMPYSHTVRWTEYVQKKKDGTPTRMWSKDGMPFNQLGKCAEAGALRKGFPNDLSGLTTADESPIIDITAADGMTEQLELKADTKPDTMYTGQLAGHVPKDPSRKTPHRLIVKLDAGGELNVATYEMPACIKEPQRFMGRRLQFSYEEKANPKGGEPFRNLKHLALEEIKVDEESKPAAADNDVQEAAQPSGPSGSVKHDAPPPSLSIQDYITRAKASESIREASEVGNMAETDPKLSKEDTATVREVVKQRMIELSSPPADKKK